jgi:uncharacterized membrane protein
MGLAAGAGFFFIYMVVLLVCFLTVRNRIRAEEQKLWCSNCRKDVVASTSMINKRANILLSVLTMGTWLIVWACTADLSTQGPPECPVCHERIQGMAGEQKPEADG